MGFKTMSGCLTWVFIALRNNLSWSLTLFLYPLLVVTASQWLAGMEVLRTVYFLLCYISHSLRDLDICVSCFDDNNSHIGRSEPCARAAV